MAARGSRYKVGSLIERALQGYTTLESWVVVLPAIPQVWRRQPRRPSENRPARRFFCIWNRILRRIAQGSQRSRPISRGFLDPPKKQRIPGVVNPAKTVKNDMARPKLPRNGKKARTARYGRYVQSLFSPQITLLPQENSPKAALQRLTPL